MSVVVILVDAVPTGKFPNEKWEGPVPALICAAVGATALVVTSQKVVPISLRLMVKSIVVG